MIVDKGELKHASVLTWEECGVAAQGDLHGSGNGTDRERHGNLSACVSVDAQESAIVRTCL